MTHEEWQFSCCWQSVKNFNETRMPVVKSKHAEIANSYNELLLKLKIMPHSILARTALLTHDTHLYDVHRYHFTTSIECNTEGKCHAMSLVGGSFIIVPTSGNDFIEWEIEPVPSLTVKKYLTFIRVAAWGSSPGLAHMA